MFSFSNTFNKASFGIDTKDYEYIKLADVANGSSPDEIHPINGLYVHGSALGDSPVVIDVQAKKLVNMPKHLGETFREILANTEAVQAIVGGADLTSTLEDYQAQVEAAVVSSVTSSAPHVGQ